MPLASYSPPQMVIQQNLEVAVSSPDPELPACVLGVSYLLSRWGKETTVGTAFDAAGQLLGWQYVDANGAIQTLPATYTPDTASVKVWAKDLRATLATYVAGDNKIYLNDLDAPNIIKISGNNFRGASLPTLFRSRPAEIGDEVDVDDGTTVRSRKIVGFVGADIAASYGTNAAATDELAANNAYNPVTDAVADAAQTLIAPGGLTVTVNQASVNLNVRGSAGYNRKVAEEFTVTVTEGGVPGNGAGSATFTITSKSGLYSATGVKSTDSSGAYLIDDSELAGATLTIDDGAVSVGQVFKFRVYQGYTRLAAGTNIVLTDSGSGYLGDKDTTYMIEVTEGSTGATATGAKLKIYDTAGLETVQTDVAVTNLDAIPLGALGLSVTFDVAAPNTVTQSGLRAGDVYYVIAKAPSQSTTNFDKAVLDGPVVDTATFLSVATALGASFKIRYGGEIAADAAADETAWSAAAGGVTVDSALALYVSTRANGYQWVAFDDAQGELHLSYRAAKPVSTATGMDYVDTEADIVSKIGTIAVDNPLAFGCAEALSGAQGGRVYFLAVGADTAAAYQTALKKLEATDKPYSLAPMTDSADVRATVRTHVLAMSSATRKNFRKAYTAIASPGRYAELLVAADSTNYTATVTAYGGENLLVTMSAAADGVDFDSLNIVEGDIFRLSVANEDYVIASKLNATQLLLQSGPVVPVSPAVPFQIWKEDTATSQGDFIIEQSNALKHRRIVPVWYEDGTRVIDGVPTVIPPMFAAAFLAGYRSYLPPQIGLSRSEVTTITAAPAMYNKYGADDLDRIAAEGVTIITQDIESGAIYVRHQLTSDTDNGILYAEDNITAVVDYVSYKFKNSALGARVGKTNVTRRSLSQMFNEAATLLDQMKQANVDSEYGPVIEDWANLKVERDATVRDRTNVTVDIAVATPNNTVWVTINAYVDLPAAA